jgi:hypothetical protein
MAERSSLGRLAWIVIAIVAVYLVEEKLRTPAAPPPTVPAATTLAPASAAEPPITVPMSDVPAAAVSPSASATPAASPSVAASPAASPTPDPAEAQRKQQQEQRIRAELAAAKSKADALTSAANTECPDLKPGELRHPGAVAHCIQLKAEATAAVNQYEALKQQAAAAGISVP